MPTTATTPTPSRSSAAAEAKAAFARGLEGIVAGESAICSVEQGKLIYRGYEIHDLAEHASFEQIAFLLLVGHKPSDAELTKFKHEIVAERPLPAPVVSFLESAGGYLASGR